MSRGFTCCSTGKGRRPTRLQTLLSAPPAMDTVWSPPHCPPARSRLSRVPCWPQNTGLGRPARQAVCTNTRMCTHNLTHTRVHTPVPSLTPSHTLLTHLRTYTLTHTLSSSHAFTPINAFTPSHTPSATHVHTCTHRHTPTFTPSHTHSHANPCSWRLLQVGSLQPP